MSDIAIRVEGLGKRYRIGRQERYRTLRDTLVEGAQRTVRTIRGWLSRDGRRESDEQTIWALKDVSFEVKRGEVLGIIGRNGAGKSTLLKILSRVTEPTEGWAEVRGRVGSLLEVGTGFHPELTGRENIYLNGAILGMKRAEIARKFDEIVAFAEVEKFIDTPVKHYSSGMYLRLAFAVAAHLEPEILLVDEVLAVGDAAFQKKCLGKMGEVAGEGRTVLFVSHNMAAIDELCSSAICLQAGRVAKSGPTPAVVSFYLAGSQRSLACDLASRVDRRGTGPARLQRVDIIDLDTGCAGTLRSGRPAAFQFAFSGPGTDLCCAFTIYTERGLPVATFHSDNRSVSDVIGGSTFRCEIGQLLLVPGRYTVNVALVRHGMLEDHIEGAASFIVQGAHVAGRVVPLGGKYGAVFMPHVWRLPTC